jgi:membrane protein
VRRALMSPKELWQLSKEAVNGWMEDRAASMGAALAYYTAFSIAPLLIITIAVAGLFFGHDAAQEALVGQMRGLLGNTGGAAIEDLLGNASDLGSGIAAIVVGVVALVLGATTAFVELQDDLDRIWKAPPRVGSGIVNLIRSRVLSFAMVLGIGFLLAVSLAVSAAVSSLGDALFGGMEIVLQAITFLLSFAIITALFAMIYKVLPNLDIDWENVWIGAAITALLFAIGKFAIGLYLGKSSIGESFGAAGPFVVLMVWIYYSTQIFLLGAEFTYAHARARGRVPSQPPATQQAPKVPGGQPAAAPSATPQGLRLPREHVASVSPRSVLQTPYVPIVRQTWLKNVGGAVAAGLVAGFAITRLALSGASSASAKTRKSGGVLDRAMNRLGYRRRRS